MSHISLALSSNIIYTEDTLLVEVNLIALHRVTMWSSSLSVALHWSKNSSVKDTGIILWITLVFICKRGSSRVVRMIWLRCADGISHLPRSILHSQPVKSIYCWVSCCCCAVLKSCSFFSCCLSQIRLHTLNEPMNLLHLLFSASVLLDCDASIISL